MNLAHAIVHGHTAYDLGEADAKRFAPVYNSLDHLMARAPEILGTHYEIAFPGRQLSTARNLRALPLDKEYKAAGAHFGQVYGWERPLYFGKSAEPKMTFDRPDWFENVRAEVMAAHEKAAIFDASPFGKIEVRGPDAEAFLQHSCAMNMAKAPGSAIYTAVLNARGTYESDITAHRLAEDHYRLFVGTNAIKRDLAWFRALATDFDVTLNDVTEDYAVLGLMGPDAARIATDLGADDLNRIGYFKHAAATLAGCEVRAVRMSYVGEAGWEITMKAEDAGTVYAALTEAGAVPAGMFAQTAMRVEKGFAAMGHELDSDVTPVEAGMDAMVAKKKTFLGSDALAERRQSASRGLMTAIFESDAAVPLGHEPIYAGGKIVGHTTTAAFGYRIGKPIALGYVHLDNADGALVEIDIAGTRHAARLQFAPAFDPDGLRMRGVS
jgi:4-methylaminobutanoate oxidase (formaldehyde-forming)